MSEPLIDDVPVSEFQNWKGMDGVIAYHLIERHADSWPDVGAMMNAWLAANIPAPPASPASKPTGEDYEKAIATIENSLTHTTHSYWEAAKYILRTAEAIARQRAGGES